MQKYGRFQCVVVFATVYVFSFRHSRGRRLDNMNSKRADNGGSKAYLKALVQ